ncbi:hypothetical protein JXA47_05030 [Candidatus Sumerlaeota bacterium]|nr:hypothetical protein [Candidatus Sumerlaeota bacterium]
MRGVRNLRVPMEQLRMRLQGHSGPNWERSDWALDPSTGRQPSAERLQQLRARVLANARQGGRREA